MSSIFHIMAIIFVLDVTNESSSSVTMAMVITNGWINIVINSQWGDGLDGLFDSRDWRLVGNGGLNFCKRGQRVN